MQRFHILLLFLYSALTLTANLLPAGEENINKNKFRQLTQELPTPNSFRTASGAPGPEYYQQKADYRIFVELDDEKHRVRGHETITYHNNSPETLKYLWVQLDQNIRAQNSDAKTTRTSTLQGRRSAIAFRRFHQQFDGGFKIEYVRDANDRDLPFTIIKTMMRIDLKSPA
ncbi:MAG: M1 family peptidase, partial [Calditrichaeota bacterium]